MNHNPYVVANIAGGTIYVGRSKQAAATATQGQYAEPYIQHGDKRYPVASVHDDESDTDSLVIGEDGQLYDDLYASL